MLIGISGDCTTRADAFYRSVMIPASHELAAVQPTCRQPHADAVVHEHLHAVGAAVGEQVGMVRARRTEDVHPPGQRSFGARAHVQRLHGQPNGIDPDQRSRSRIQPAKSADADNGQVIVIAVAPRRSWIWMSPAGVGAGTALAEPSRQRFAKA
jgi:hypothetical protein